jgi:hypothetical protein
MKNEGKLVLAQRREIPIGQSTEYDPVERGGVDLFSFS